MKHLNIHVCRDKTLDCTLNEFQVHALPGEVIPLLCSIELTAQGEFHDPRTNAMVAFNGDRRRLQEWIADAHAAHDALNEHDLFSEPAPNAFGSAAQLLASVMRVGAFPSEDAAVLDFQLRALEARDAQMRQFLAEGL